jgi:hypothetical protein
MPDRTTDHPTSQDAAILAGDLALARTGGYPFPVADANALRTAHGFKDASSDPAQILAWLDRFPGTRPALCRAIPT